MIFYHRRTAGRGRTAYSAHEAVGVLCMYNSLLNRTDIFEAGAERKKAWLGRRKAKRLFEQSYQSILS